MPQRLRRHGRGPLKRPWLPAGCDESTPARSRSNLPADSPHLPPRGVGGLARGASVVGIRAVALSMTDKGTLDRREVAIEIERRNRSLKYPNGSMFNSSAFGRIGIVVAWDQGRLEDLLRARENFAYLGDLRKNTFNTENLFILSKDQFARSVERAAERVEPQGRRRPGTRAVAVSKDPVFSPRPLDRMSAIGRGSQCGLRVGGRGGNT
jgi:hypothetical protein